MYRFALLLSAYKEKRGPLDNERGYEIVSGDDHVGNKLGALISRWSNDNISMSKFLNMSPRLPKAEARGDE
jgi:hypothetical protein